MQPHSLSFIHCSSISVIVNTINRSEWVADELRKAQNPAEVNRHTFSSLLNSAHEVTLRFYMKDT